MKYLLIVLLMLLGGLVSSPVAFGEGKFEGGVFFSPTPTPWPASLPEKYKEDRPLIHPGDQAWIDAGSEAAKGWWDWFYQDTIIGQIVGLFLGAIKAFLGMIVSLLSALTFLINFWWIILPLLIWKSPGLLKGIGSFLLAFAKGVGKGLVLFGTRRWW